MGNVKVAIHQPNYLPWLGYFNKICNADTFVLLDTVQFDRRGYSNRVRVSRPGGGVLWLTQNILKQPRSEHFVQDVFFSDKRWIKKHLKTFDAAYRKAPHFEKVFSLIEQSMQSDTGNLSIFNGTLIRNICDALGVSTRIVYASELNAGEFSSASERLACITHLLGGTLYLSGSGAKAYNDPAAFARYGVELAYNDFVIKPYPRCNPVFEGGLSIVDSLFNIGFGGVAALLGGNSKNDLNFTAVSRIKECGSPACEAE
jgi:hypothetical protein